MYLVIFLIALTRLPNGPNALYNVRDGLDPSFHFFINYAPHNDFIWGKDFIITVGPLGFLKYPPIAFGYNILLTFVFWHFLWITFVITIYTIFKK